ncbi:hypothetical protein [Paenibacillus eucommiae]|uniref:Uncharacterized protein n=1 Tax=Paenibacillus eucommiae TaxID=1355755 RepID=A0ABS4IVQ0_9BACL|nr:hypothetical protein [Paenibacillus eucommiae]MBP1991659.1 hypothetical protein [Paenibacillus eucommiae]
MFFIVKASCGGDLELLTMKNIVKVAEPLLSLVPLPQQLGLRRSPLQSREKPLLAVRLSLVFV